MLAVAFDTLKLAQRLRDEVKFPPDQAERAAAVLADTFADWQARLSLATKDDLDRLQATAKAELQNIQSAMRELELRITVRLGGMIVALGGILIAVRYFG